MIDKVFDSMIINLEMSEASKYNINLFVCFFIIKFKALHHMPT